jgi:ATP-dependent DNA helicase RecQ
MHAVPGREHDLQAAATRIFGWDELRPDQVTAMAAALDGRDVLAVMPTGSGKSAIYQVPSVLLDGATLVVSPLIALQEDQIAGLADTEAPAGVAINSTSAARASWDAVRRHEADYIFAAPEQLAKDDVLQRLGEAELSLIVVDEAHCVSAWGHDFRPDYLRLADAFERLGPGVPVIALTATASVVVRKEIAERLRLRDPVTVVASFDRPNLDLTVEHHLDDDPKRAAVLDCVAQLPGPGLLYTATRKDAETYADALRERGLTAAAYHAGMSAGDRERVHEGFRDDEYHCVAATSAFGMGIDKPNVRFVVHASAPDSLDTYYQQIGRGGRDGEPARAVLFYRAEDLGLARFFTTHRPDEDLLWRLYSVLGTPKKLKHIREELGEKGRKLTNALNLLDDAGMIRSTKKGFVAGDARAEEAVDAAVHVVELRERVDQSRVEMMRGYAETAGCRRQFLLAYFGEQLAEPCGHCDRCRAGLSEEDAHGDEPPIAVDTEVRHREWGHGVVIGGEDDRVTVLFDDHGYRTLAMAAVRENSLLEQL